jgi:phosphoribosylamine--glycine ligase
VLEFNARFGDPEAQVLMPLLDGQLGEALLGAAIGDRGAMEGSVAIGSSSAVGVVVASPGYPERPETDLAIEGADPAGPRDDGPLLCFHAATRSEGAGHVAAGGRVVTFVGLGPDLATARENAYGGVAGCRLEGSQHRGDIAKREVVS